MKQNESLCSNKLLPLLPILTLCFVFVNVLDAGCRPMWVRGAFPASVDYSMRTDPILWLKTNKQKKILDTDHWGVERKQKAVVARPWIEGKFAYLWCCGPWSTSALQVKGSGPWEGLQGGGGGQDWQDRMPTECHWDALSEVGCGTSSFCWRSTPGPISSTSER